MIQIELILSNFSSGIFFSSLPAFPKYHAYALDWDSKLIMNSAEDEKDPLVGPSNREHIVEITMSKKTPSISRAAPLRSRGALLGAIRKWWSVSKLWFTGMALLSISSYSLFIPHLPQPPPPFFFYQCRRPAR